MMNSWRIARGLPAICCASLVILSGAAYPQVPLSQHQPLLQPSSQAALITTPLYVLDPIETRSRFEVLFLGFMTVRGKFNRTTGTLNHDPERADAASRANDAIQATIDSTTVSANVVNSAATNKVLRSAAFFHVEKFPNIEFKSSRFVWEADKLTAIDGTLTLVGVTKSVRLLVQNSGCTAAHAAKRARCTADAYLNVKRSDFGMKAWSASVGDEIKIIVELVAYAGSGSASTDTKPDEKLDQPRAPNPPPAQPNPPAQPSEAAYPSQPRSANTEH